MNANYVMPLENLELTNKIIVLVGSSGSGKTTLAKKLSNDLKISQLITTTTRDIRDGESDEVDYHFVDVEKFRLMNELNCFLETTLYSGHQYGLTYDEVIKYDNQLCYVITDTNGARAIADAFPERVMIFWLRSNPTLLVKRLSDRGDSIKSVMERLYSAMKNKEFKSPYKEFVDVSFTELRADTNINNNFGIIYYKLLTAEYSNNASYLHKLERGKGE